MCCVRQLAIFHGKCDWHQVDRLLPTNPTIGSHGKYSDMHVCLFRRFFLSVQNKYPQKYSKSDMLCKTTWNFLEKMGLALDRQRVAYESNNWISLEILIQTEGTHFGSFSLPLDTNIHKNIQSPIDLCPSKWHFLKNVTGRR